MATALFTAESNGQDDIIKVAEGTYKGIFAYSSAEAFSLTIEGGYNATCTSRQIKPATTVLNASHSGIVLLLATTAASDFVVDGLTLQKGNEGAGGGFMGTGLRILTAGGQVTIRHTVIQKNRATGLEVKGAASVLLTGNTIQDNLNRGVFLSDAFTVTLRNNRIQKNSFTGLEIHNVLRATFVNNTLSENIHAAFIIAAQDAQLTFVKNKVIANGQGITAFGVGTEEASMTMAGNTIRGHRPNGVDIRGIQKVTLRQNVIQDNGDGILVSGPKRCTPQ